MRYSRLGLGLSAWAVALVVGCEKKPAAPTPQAAPAAAALSPQVVELNNRGVGLMGQFKYEQAADEFSQALKLLPDSADLKVNLAIAVLNQDRTEAADEALQILAEVLAKEPRHPRANYCSAVLLKYKGRLAETFEHFRVAAEASPPDAYAAFSVGECYWRERKLDEAQKWEETALDIDPYLGSAYYQLSQILMRTGKVEEGKARQATFEKLKSNPLGRFFDFKYTKMGRLAETIALGLPAAEQRPTAEADPKSWFAAAQPLKLAEAAAVTWVAPSAGAQPGITACDIDGDDAIDLFISGAIEHDGKLKNAVLLRRGSEFVLQLEHPLALVSDVRAALWGDYDNDGLTDVYFCRPSANQLWRQQEKNVWADVTSATGAEGGPHATVAGAMADLDHDGDLDLFLVRDDGPNELLINTNYADGSAAAKKSANDARQATFRAIGAERGITGDGRPSRAIVLADIDGDRDTDLIVVHQEPPHEVYRNDLLWNYGPADGFDEFKRAAIGALVAADADHDGRIELYSLAQGKLTRWQPDESGMWKSQTLATTSEAVLGPEHLAVADLAGSGESQALLGSRAGCQLVAGLQIGRPTTISVGQESAGWAMAPLDPLHGYAVVALSPSGAPVVYQPGQGRQSFAALRLAGRDLAEKQSRSNASGIGAHILARSGSAWTTASTFAEQSIPGQSLTPALLGMGTAKQIDVLAIHWSGGVYQTELNLDAGKVHKIVEENRVPISCPLLFAWNGTQLAFVADLLGVGGLGYAIGPGTYATPDATENFLLPLEAIAPREGKYVLTLEEAGEESTYVDRVGLVAYDVPPGWKVVLDERMATSPPAATGDPQFYQELLLPERATNDRGADVTEQLAHADGVAAEPGQRDRRFIGLVEEHQVTLEFAQPLDGAVGHPVLVMDGWIEYPYSQTVFASWQAGAEYRAPTLEARDGRGAWHTVAVQFGYPAGTPRQASYPLPTLPPETRALRLTTTYEIYWDRLAVALVQPCPQAIRRELPLVSAQLAITGFPRRTFLDQHRPTFDSRQRSRFGDARRQSGLFTRFGRVDELIAERDDALAIYGPGEGLQLEFRAPDGQPPAGWTRCLVLETVGWCKDMDFYTEHGQTVEPLPTGGSRTPNQERRRQLLHNEYNDRATGGY